MTAADDLRAALADAKTTPNQVVLQFSTTQPQWRWCAQYAWFPDAIRHNFPLGLLFDANWASPLIRRLCHSPFSHVDFVLPNGNLLGASAQGKLSPLIEGNSNGVAVRPSDYQPFGVRRRAIIKTDLAPHILAAAVSQLGKPFDGQALKCFLSEGNIGARDWRDPDAWFCAELVVWAFERAGFWFPEELIWPKDRFSPTDLIILFLMDPRFVNRRTFWEAISDLSLAVGER